MINASHKSCTHYTALGVLGPLHLKLTKIGQKLADKVITRNATINPKKRILL